MKKYSIIAFLIAISLLAFPTLAENLCLDNTTIMKNFGNLTVGNITTPFSSVQSCEFGCDLENNRCNPSPFDTLLWYIIGSVVGVIILILVILKLAK